MNDIGVVFAITVVVVALFVWNRVPVVIVALATPVALYFTGILTVSEAVAGLGDAVVVFLASLFVVSGGLEAAGVTTWVGQLLIAKAGTSRMRLLILLMLLAALLSGLIGFVGTVAGLLPVVVVVAIRLGIPTSQLLIPLAFAASAGGLLTLGGSPVNLIAFNAAEDAGLDALGYFEFALAGIPALLGTMAIILLFGSRLLPKRSGASLPADFSAHAKTLVEQFRLEGDVHRLRVRVNSPYVGKSRDDLELRDYPGLSLVAVYEGEGTQPMQRTVLAEGDVLMLRGDPESLGRLATDKHLSVEPGEAASGVEETLFHRKSGLAEVMVPPRSKLVGQTVFPGMAALEGDLILLAVQRGGEDLGTKPVTLAVGDHLLLQGTWQALERNLDDPQVLVVDSPAVVRRQAVPLGFKAKEALAIMGVLVVLLATSAAPPAIVGLVCAGAMVLFGVLTVPQAYKSIDWTACLLIGGMIPLSTAMSKTGAASQMAEQLKIWVGDAGPQALLAGLFLLTAILGQLISNTATALVVMPIALAAAEGLGVSARPVLMSITVAATAAFLTPVATPGNLMVMGPGGYAFGDYWKLGLPCLLWFFIVAVFIVPLVWRF